MQLKRCIDSFGNQPKPKGHSRMKTACMKLLYAGILHACHRKTAVGSAQKEQVQQIFYGTNKRSALVTNLADTEY